MGSYSYGQPDIVFQYSNAKLIVGKFCSLSNPKIFLGGEHRPDWVTTYPFGHIHQNVFNTFDGVGHGLPKGDVVIGNDVWVGAYVTIMSGITIGDGAVIAANSHVVKNVEPYSVVGGNPARLIRYRFSHDQIDNLMKIRWWDWSTEKINENIPLMCDTNIDRFIEKHRLPLLDETGVTHPGVTPPG